MTPEQPATDATAAIPVLTLDGDARRRGEIHGETLRPLIGEAIERHADLIARQRGDSVDAYISTFLAETGFLDTMERRSPELLEEVTAIARAANQPFDHVLLLNLMDEFWWYQPQNPSGGCSVTGVAGTGTRRGVLGQNMDLPSWMLGLQTVLRVRAEDQDAIIVSSAGLVGLMGVNRSGLGVCVNTLFAMPRSLRGLPVAFVFREVLERRTLDAGVGYLGTVPHASGQHYALGTADGIIGVECGADYVAGRHFGAEPMRHTNHPLWSAPHLCLSGEETGFAGPRLAYSEERLHALGREEHEPTLAGLERVLSNPSSGLCMIATPEIPSETFASMAVTLEPEPEVRLALGRPDITEWQTLRWD